MIIRKEHLGYGVYAETDSVSEVIVLRKPIRVGSASFVLALVPEVALALHAYLEKAISVRLEDKIDKE